MDATPLIGSKTNRTLYAPLSSRFVQVTKIARNSAWFIAQFALVVIGRNKYFSIGVSKFILSEWCTCKAVDFGSFQNS